VSFSPGVKNEGEHPYMPTNLIPGASTFSKTRSAQTFIESHSRKSGPVDTHSHNTMPKKKKNNLPSLGPVIQNLRQTQSNRP